jgi:hypothetical protein
VSAAVHRELRPAFFARGAAGRLADLPVGCVVDLTVTRAGWNI